MSRMENNWKDAEGFAFLPAPDRLWLHAPTPFVTHYNVMGVPLEFGTNAPVLAALAEEVFGDWEPPDVQIGQEVCRLNVFLHDGPETPHPKGHPFPLMRAQGDYFFLVVGHSFGFADRAAGFGTAYVTPALLSDQRFVQTAFIECLGIYLVNPAHRVVLHAAGVVHRDRCVLLSGGDGVGKSTLAYACLRAGFSLLAEDTVFVEEKGDAMWVWGNPWHLHLLPDAAHFFPELVGAEPVRMLNGTTKLRIRVRAVRPDAALSHMPVWGVISLSRGPGQTSILRPADPAQVQYALTHFKDNPPVDQAAMAAVAERLLSGRVAHLEVGTDLDQAVEVLQRWIEFGIRD